MSTKQARILPDYTRQGKSTIPSRRWAAENTEHKTKPLRVSEVLDFGDVNIQITLESSITLKDSIDTMVDGSIVDEYLDRDGFIDFYLKIPPKNLRLKREHSNEMLQCYIPLNKKATKKKRKSIINRLLSDVDNQVISDPCQANAAQCCRSCLSLLSNSTMSSTK